MDRDSGWARVLDSDSDEVMARGRVMLSSAPRPAQGSPEAIANRGQLTPQTGGAPRRGNWTGYLDSVRTSGDTDLAPGPYRLCFEHNDEILRIRVLSWEGPGSESQPGRAEIESTDGMLPSMLLEVGGDG